MIRRYCKQYGEIILLLALIAACAFLVSVGLQIPVGRGKSPIVPSTWPVASLLLIAGSSLIILLLRFLRKSQPALEDKQKEDAQQSDTVPGEGAEDAAHPQRAFYTILFMVGYMALIPYAGFMVTTLAGMALYMLSVGVRRIYAIIIPLLLTALITGIFGIALKVPLPRGVSVFQSFSYMIY